MMLTDVPECVFGKSIAPLLALDDLYRLAHSSRTMSLIAKQSIQKIVQRDFAMTDLIEQAAYRVVANTGLPIDSVMNLQLQQARSSVLANPARR